MASDPTGVHPSGVLVRNAPDFFDDQLGSGGYFAAVASTPGHDTYFRLSLYNNATDGRALKVYGITAQDNAGGGSYLYQAYGPNPDTLVGPCVNIRGDLGQPWGVIYQQLTLVLSGAGSPFTRPAAAVVLGESGFDAFTTISPFPLQIVPRGFSLFMEQTQHDGGQYGGGFWFQMSNE